MRKTSSLQPNPLSPPRPVFGAQYNLNRDGISDLIVVAGEGGGPRVAVWDGSTIEAGRTPQRLLSDFFVFEPTFRGGAFVAAGDVNGDGVAELIATAGAGGGPRVRVFDGSPLLTNRPVTLADLFVGDTVERLGGRVVVKDVDGDTLADVVTASGAVVNTLNAYSGSSIAKGTPAVAKRFEVHEAFTNRDLGFRGGIFLG